MMISRLPFLLVFVLAIFCQNAFAVDCSKEIIARTCRVETLPEYNSRVDLLDYYNRSLNPECESDSGEYGKIVLDVYSKLPEHSKAAFCLIKRIIIVPKETNFGGSARYYFSTREGDYSFEPSPLQDMQYFKTKILGYILSLNIIRFSAVETMEEYLTKVFSIPFKRSGFVSSGEPGISIPDLPVVKINSKFYRYDNLRRTIIHEIGHFLDFSNDIVDGFYITGDFNVDYSRLNLFSHQYPFRLEADPFNFLKYSWYYGLQDPRVNSSEFEDDGGSISNFTMIPFAKSILRPSLWPIENNNFPEFYEKLQNSKFITYYALQSPAEDLAETYLHYVDGVNFKVEKDGIVYYDESLKYSNPDYMAKIEILKNIMDAGFENAIGREIKILVAD